MAYNFRFDFEQEQLDAIFEDPEIAERFNGILKEHQKMLEKMIPQIRDFVFRLLENKKEKTKKFKKKCTHEYIMKKFEQGLKAQILFNAMQAVFYDSNLDLKQTILESLSSKSIEKMVQSKMVDVFSTMTDFRYDEELRQFE